MAKQGNQRQASLLYSYLAGVIDSEGTIRINKYVWKETKETQNPMYHPLVCMCMVNKDVPMLFQTTFGGSVRIEKVRVPNRRAVYRWQASGRNSVINVLSKLGKYLIVKKEQYELLLRFCKEKSWRKKVDKMIKCESCGKTKKRRAFNLCGTCYISIRRKGLIDKYRTNIRKSNHYLPDWEIQRREEFYQKIKKLNAVGAAAETK